MHWELAHRPRDTSTATTQVTIEAPGSSQAIGALRAQMPADDVVLYVRTAA